MSEHDSYCNYPNDPCCCGKTGKSKEFEDYYNGDREKKDEILNRIEKRRKRIKEGVE